jgi:hypothetical protein
MYLQDSRHTDNKISTERIIDLVREVRNGLIRDFLQDETISTYFREQYNKELSQIKLEFLKRDLKELMTSAVDLPHYALLIKQMQELNSASITSSNHELFYKELEGIFKKYNY